MTESLQPATPIGQAQLAELRTRLSARDEQILRFLSRHRYATTTHLRDVFFHGHATMTAGTRACVRVLHRLLRDRLIARLERRVGGSQRGSAASIWYLDAPGERLTRTDGAPRRRFATISLPFLDHTLAIVDTHVALIAAARDGVFAIERVAIETEAWRSYVTSSGATSILKPDLAVHLSTDEYDDHWYLEIDRGTKSLPVLLSKCRAYAAYRATGRAQAQYGVFPRVLWLLPTQARADRLTAALRAEPGLDQRLFLASSHDALLSSLMDPDGGTVSQEVTVPQTADPRGQHEAP